MRRLHCQPRLNCWCVLRLRHPSPELAEIQNTKNTRNLHLLILKASPKVAIETDSKIPAEWVSKTIHGQRVSDLANKLAALRGGAPTAPPPAREAKDSSCCTLN
eukprot:s1765_g18.t1